MEDNNIKSNFQFIDSYITHSSMDIINRKKIESTLELNIESRISEIKKTDNKLSAEMRLKNNIIVREKNTNKELTKIEVEMAGIFLANDMKEEEFIKYMKYSGAPLLSQSIRSYVMTITSLAGINMIRIPLINYIEFFKENDKNK